MMALVEGAVVEDDFATKRDAYYQSKNWGEARFDEQAESDTVMDDIEAMFSLDGVTREQLRFIPDEHGGAVAGELIVDRPRPGDGRDSSGSTARSSARAPTRSRHSVEHLKFKTKAKFILAIETGGMFQRLQSHKYLAEGELHPGLDGRRADARDPPLRPAPLRGPEDPGLRLRRLRSVRDLQHLPHAQGRLGQRGAHQPVLLRAAGARILGVTPQDIVDYKLPTHPLKDVDVKRAKDALKNDPFFQAHKPGARRWRSCSRWASAPSSRRSRSGGSTT